MRMLDSADSVKELHTIRDYVRWCTSLMYQHQVYLGHGHINPADEARQLVLNAVHLPWDSDENLLDARLLESERQQVVHYIEQRVIERVPLPYITAEAWFMGLPFYVDQRVLIPRSPIAQLIETEFSPFLRPGPVHRVLDLCSGSGCIGIALAYTFEEAEVDLADISEDALAVAEINIERHGMAGQVTPIASDIFSGVAGQRYDLIVANPPYVDAEDLADMPEEYHHEPALALGSGEDGLELTRKMLAQANDYLAEDGLLVVEVGNSEVHLAEQYPQVPFIWVELPSGGNGVFAIGAGELSQYRHLFE